MASSTKNPTKTRFGKATTDGEVGATECRYCVAADPNDPCPVHNVDARRINYNAAPEPKPAQRVKHTATDFDKQVEERAAFRDRVVDEDDAEDLLLAPSPMHEIVERYGAQNPGMSNAFMSEHAEKVLGRRGYVPVKDERGDVVKLGTLTLVEIPTKIQEARQRKAQRESASHVNTMADEYGESVRRLQSDAKDLGLRVLNPGEMNGDFTNPETGQTVRIG